MDMESPEVKTALHKKKESIVIKKGKPVEKKIKIKCSEPEVLLDSQNGSIIKTCVSSKVPEWKSLALLGS
jgi:hypothetical protein